MAKTVTETTAFHVTSFETARWLLREKPDSTWAWRLIPRDGGRTHPICRLRQRYRWQTPGPAPLTVVLLEFGDFPMVPRVLGAARPAPNTGQTAGALAYRRFRLLARSTTSPTIPDFSGPPNLCDF